LRTAAHASFAIRDALQIAIVDPPDLAAVAGITLFRARAADVRLVARGRHGPAAYAAKRE